MTFDHAPDCPAASAPIGRGVCALCQRTGRPTFRFYRVDNLVLDVGPRAVYRGECLACNLRFDMTADRYLVQRERDDEEPTPEQAKNEAWQIIDLFLGGPARRARRREVEGIERDLERRARHELARAGCTHAQARSAIIDA